MKKSGTNKRKSCSVCCYNIVVIYCFIKLVQTRVYWANIIIAISIPYKLSGLFQQLYLIHRFFCIFAAMYFFELIQSTFNLYVEYFEWNNLLQSYTRNFLIKLLWLFICSFVKDRLNFYISMKRRTWKATYKFNLGLVEYNQVIRLGYDIHEEYLTFANIREFLFLSEEFMHSFSEMNYNCCCVECC